jgi:pilus assembly protein CpaB
MRLIRILGIVVSVLAAAASVWWFRSGVVREAAEQQVETVKKLSLVVAAEPLRYGQRITQRQLKVIDWLGTSLPADAFGTVEAVGITQDGPFALAMIAQGVPIVKSQITAPGQKPSLSARLSPDEVAVTIPVNTITGVAGFVLPEERVDVILNRQMDGRHFADVILQNVRVLAVNSIPDATGGEPVLAKSLTFATSREDAQRLEVAAELGEISLVLRSPMTEENRPSRTISDLEVVSGERGQPAAPTPAIEEQPAVVPPPEPPADALPQPADAEVKRPPEKSVVTVIRGLSREEVTVP